MKTAPPCRHHLLLIMLILGALACGGSRQQTTQPTPHLADGIRELEKADAWYRKGCYPKALHHYQRAYPELVAGDHLHGMAVCLNNMGNVYLRTGKSESALLFFDEAIENHHLAADTGGIRAALVNKAAALIQLEKFDAAGAALAEARALGSISASEAAPLLAAEAVLQMRLGDSGAARALAGQAQAAVGRRDDATTAVIHDTLGQLERAGGALDESAAHFEKALAADRRQGYYRGMAADLSALGAISAAQGRHREAAGRYKRSISLYALIGESAAADALRGPLAQAAAAAGQSTDVTLYFVDDWLGNKAFNGPCE